MTAARPIPEEGAAPPSPRPDLLGASLTESPFGRAFRVLDASLTLVGTVLGRTQKLVHDVQRDSRAVAKESKALYAASGRALSTVRETIRATPRFTRILTEGMGLIARYRIHRAKAAHLPPELAEVQLAALHASSARRLHDLCVELGGGVLKLGQFVSCRLDLLPPVYAETLAALCDRVPAEALEDVVARIEAELGRPLAELFPVFETEPLAAASLAQVHAAELPDGTRVAVKVQRPGIEEVVEVDVSAMRVLAMVLSEMVPAGDMLTFTREIAMSLVEELDFAAEARSVTAFGELLAGDDRVIVPRVHATHSTARVLTMDLIDGERLLDFLDGCQRRGDEGRTERDRLFHILVDCFTAQILVHERLHSDPHPGNFLVAEGPRLVLLDFGAVRSFDPGTGRAYAELVGAVLGGQAARAAELLRTMGFRTRDDDPATLVRFAELMLEAFRESAGKVGDMDPLAQVAEALELARDNPVVTVPADFVMIGRVLATLAGFVVHYRPDIDLFRIVAPHLATALSSPPRVE